MAHDGPGLAGQSPYGGFEQIDPTIDGAAAAEARRIQAEEWASLDAAAAATGSEPVQPVADKATRRGEWDDDEFHDDVWGKRTVPRSSGTLGVGGYHDDPHDNGEDWY